MLCLSGFELSSRWVVVVVLVVVVVCPWNFHLLILFTSFLCHQNHSYTVLNAKNLQTSIISDTTRNAHLFGNIRQFIQRLRRRLRKRHLKSEFALPQTWSHLFHLVKFVKCWQSFLELNSKGRHQSSGKEKKVVVFCSRPWQNVKRCSRATTAEKCTKKRDARAKLLFCFS